MGNLKNCPFCNGDASRSVSKIKGNENYWEIEAHCHRCGAEIRKRIYFGPWTKDPEREAKRIISMMWNRRYCNGLQDVR